MGHISEGKAVKTLSEVVKLKLWVCVIAYFCLLALINNFVSLRNGTLVNRQCVRPERVLLFM